MGIVRRYIDGPSGQIHLAEAGRGPSVLLLHQTPRSWDEFSEVMAALEDRLHMIAMDLPGMGSSDQHPDGPSIENYASAAAAAITLSGRGPMAVCGHHTGGVVAVELASSRPRLVKQLILSSTPWIDASERARRALKQPIDTVELRPDGSHLLDMWNQRAPFYNGSTDQLTRFVRDALRADDPAAGHRAVGRYRMEDSAQRVRCPVTIVEHASDPFASPHTSTLRKRFDGAQVEVIEDGRVPLEATAAVFASRLLQAVEEQPTERPGGQPSERPSDRPSDRPRKTVREQPSQQPS